MSRCYKKKERISIKLVNKPKRTKIIIGSKQSQIIANAIENNYSYRETTDLVNQYNNRMGLEWSTKSAVYGCIRAMSGKYFGAEKHKQGSTDSNSNWAKARTNWTKQLLIRLGEIKWNDENDGPAPSYFDIQKLKPLDLTQIVYWDETHKN